MAETNTAVYREALVDYLCANIESGAYKITDCGALAYILIDRFTMAQINIIPDGDHIRTRRGVSVVGRQRVNRVVKAIRAKKESE